MNVRGVDDHNLRPGTSISHVTEGSARAVSRVHLRVPTHHLLSAMSTSDQLRLFSQLTSRNFKTSSRIRLSSARRFNSSQAKPNSTADKNTLSWAEYLSIRGRKRRWEIVSKFELLIRLTDLCDSNPLRSILSVGGNDSEYNFGIRRRCYVFRRSGN